MNLSIGMLDDTHKGIVLSAGWIVNPNVFHNRIPSLFASYMVNDMICYSFNPNCKEFVMNVPAIHHVPFSVFNGMQYDIDVKIIKDKDYSKRWRLVISNMDFGYWRVSRLISQLEGGANVVGWGGVVFKSNNVSTNPTAMGSGFGPEKGYLRASFIGDVQYIDNNYTIRNPDSYNLKAFMTNPTRYRVGYSTHDKSHPTSFYYGGPRY
ncbi:hypothetical protein vseg_015302 [Gypsophila vaccaria]